MHECMYVCMSVCMYVWSHMYTFSKSMDQPGKVANPARGQLKRENEYFSVPVRLYIIKYKISALDPPV